jgi:hypothetical protein
MLILFKPGAGERDKLPRAGPSVASGSSFIRDDVCTWSRPVSVAAQMTAQSNALYLFTCEKVSQFLHGLSFTFTFR